MEGSVNRRILWQVLSWIVLWTLLPVLFIGEPIPKEVIPRAIGMFIGLIFMITINLKFLFPKFYSQKYFRNYILLCVVFAFTISFIINSIFGFYISPQELPLTDLELRPHVLSSFSYLKGAMPLLIALIGSTMYEIAVLANQSAQEANLLKSEKLEAELKFLKSQINPHFLFNSLNNIYTLTMLNPKAAGDSLLELSAMLRYLLYECDADKVSLGREISYLENYINLFLLKDEEQLNITFDANDINEEVMIAPLLLIPFIENAFKHSQIEDLEKGWINIQLFGDDKQVYLEVKNSSPEIAFAKDEIGGIGLQNVKRQLELVYPNKHQLEIKNGENSFEVYLTIYL